MSSEKLSDVRKALQKPAAERSAVEVVQVEKAQPAVADAMERFRNAFAKLREFHPSIGETPEYKPLRVNVPVGLNIIENARRLDREKEERLSREIAMLDALQAINGHIRGLNERLSKQDEQLREHEQELARIRTGAPGRPSAMHFVVAEFEERVKQRRIESNLSDQSRVLAEWLREIHPLAARTTAKTIENKIRSAFRRARHQAGSDAEQPRKKKGKTTSRTPQN